MNTKGFLTAIGLLLIAIITIYFLLPSKLLVEYSQELKASPEQVFAQVNNLKNWNNWAKWNQIDPDMETFYGDKVAGKGASYTWKSDHKMVGNGSMKITDSKINELVSTEMTFEGFDGSAYADIDIEPGTEGGSKVTWDFRGDAGKYLYKFMSAFMMKGSIKKSYAESFDNLDAFIATNPDAHKSSGIEMPTYTEEQLNTIPIEIVDLPEFNAITVKRSGNISEMSSDVFGEALGTSMVAIEKAGAQFAGVPFSQWHKWEPENDYYEMEAGAPVTGGGTLHKGGKMVKASYLGDYHGTALAHEAAHAYIRRNGHEFNGAPYEMYVTDPQEEPDTTKWLTEVYYPIK